MTGLRAARTFALLLFTALSLAWPVSTAVAAPDAEDIIIMVGESRSVSAPGVSSVVVGNPAVMDAVAPPGSEQVVISGLAVGKSSLVLSRGPRRITYIVRVYSTPPAELVRQLTTLLRSVQGISVGQVGDRVVIDGRVYSAGDKARVDSVVTLYKGEVESIVRFDEYSAARRPMFALEVHVVEIKTEDAHHLGLDLPAQFSATTNAQIDYSKDLNGGGSSRVLSAVVQSNPLIIGLNLLSREGLATIRGLSTLVTEAGETATYDVGGQLFVKSTGLNGGTLDRIRYGTALKILPTWDEEQRIVKLTIDASVSSIDNSQIVDGVPSLITNAVQTRVNLKEAETIILSGLDAKNEGHTDTGLWPFARIPILGYLFKSQIKNDTTRKTLIFVTPHLYKPGDDLHRKLLEPMLDRGAPAEESDDF